MNKFIPFILIIFLSVGSYANIFGNDFVWDDNRFIVDRVEIRSWETTLQSFGSATFDIYRPMRTVLYFAAYSLFGQNPLGYHVLSIALHTLVTIFIYLILNRILKNRIALIASLLFAVHPLHVGRVTNMTASFDLAGILIYVISFYLYLIFAEKKKKRWLYASISLFTLGLFFSEELFTLPLLILAYEAIYNKALKKSTLWYFLPLAFFVFLRVVVLDIGARSAGYPTGSFATTMYSMPLVVIQYLLLSFVPIGLSPFREASTVSSPNFWFLLPLAILATLVFFVIKKGKDHMKFFASFFVITLLPFLNFLPIQQLMAERYMYLGVLGIIVLVCLVLSRFNALALSPKIKIEHVGKGVLVLVIVVFIILTLHANTFWKNEPVLYTRALQLYPENPKVHNNLGTLYFQAGVYENAVESFQQAVTIDPTFDKAWVNLGVIVSRLGDQQSAIQAFEAALTYAPNNWEAYDRLGVAHMRAGDSAAAEQAFFAAINLNNQYYPSYARLGSLYGQSSEFDRAEALLRKALEINPKYAEAYYNLGIIYEARGDQENAIKLFNTAYSLDPQNENYKKKAR